MTIICLKGNIETKMNRPDIKSRNVEMRNELDLFVNLIHCKSQPGIKTRHEDIDIVVSSHPTFTAVHNFVKTVKRISFSRNEDLSF